MQLRCLRTTGILACGGGMIALALTACNSNGTSEWGRSIHGEW
jgi:hypothetical protein